MVFEAGFRVIFVIVFVFVLLSFCVTQILPIRGPWDIRVPDLFIQMNDRGASAASQLGYR